MKRFFYLLLAVVFLGSCVSKKTITYFQNDAVDFEKVSNDYQTIFKPDDFLEITVLSEDLESVKPFNLPAAAFSAATNLPIGNPQQQRYLIDKNGDINFPVIGKIKLGGLTRQEGIDLIVSKLSPDYVKDPSVNIYISNFKVTILGDVQRPGVYSITGERVTILEAIGMAGDLNISGRRMDVRLTREVGGKKEFYEIDLLSKKVFTSPAYYLQQNDVIYVDPNGAKAQSAATNQNTGLFVSIGSIIISLIAVLTR